MHYLEFGLRIYVVFSLWLLRTFGEPQCMQTDMIISRKSFGVLEIERCVSDTVPPTRAV